MQNAEPLDQRDDAVRRRRATRSRSSSTAADIAGTVLAELDRATSTHARSMRIAHDRPLWFPVPPTGYGGIELVVVAARRRPRRRRPRRHAVRARRIATKAKLVSPLLDPPDPALLGNPGTTRTTPSARRTSQIDDFDVVHDHSGIVGPAAAARCSADQPAGRAHAARTVDRAEPPLYSLLARHVHLVAISERSAPTTPTSRTPASCTTASTSPTYPFRDREGRLPRLHRARQPRQGPERGDRDRPARRAAACAW